MKKFILAVACIFALGTSLSAQCNAKTDSTKKCVAAKTGATEQAHSDQCCSGKTKRCDCKEGAACSTPEGAKVCAAHHAAVAQDSVKACCKADNHHAKCGKKDCAKCKATRDHAANCTDAACTICHPTMTKGDQKSCCKADNKKAKGEKKACCKRDMKKGEKKSCCQKK